MIFSMVWAIDIKECDFTTWYIPIELSLNKSFVIFHNRFLQEAGENEHCCNISNQAKQRLFQRLARYTPIF